MRLRRRSAATAHQHHRSRTAAAEHENGRQDDEEHQRLAGHLLLDRRALAFGACVWRGRIRFLGLFLFRHWPPTPGNH
jgi:hypothetical protein